MENGKMTIMIPIEKTANPKVFLIGPDRALCANKAECKAKLMSEAKAGVELAMEQMFPPKVKAETPAE